MHCSDAAMLVSVVAALLPRMSAAVGLQNRLLSLQYACIAFATWLHRPVMHHKFATVTVITKILHWIFLRLIEWILIVLTSIASNITEVISGSFRPPEQHADSCVCAVRYDFLLAFCMMKPGWLGSRVVSVLDSGAEGPGLNRSCDAVG